MSPTKTFKTPKGTELPIMNLKGKDYLQVPYRIVWFREEHTNHSVETEFLINNQNEAFCRAVIRDHQGRILQTGHKYENKQGFADFREKAETGAIGRALGALGYGTQFAPELEEGNRLADSPLGPDADLPTPSTPAARTGKSVNADRLATQKQVNMVWAKLMALGYSEDQATRFRESVIGKKHNSMITMAEIDRLLEAISRIGQEDMPAPMQAQEEPGELLDEIH